MDETEFLHASAPSLLGPWTIEPDVIPAERAEGANVVWAPHVVSAPGAWEMMFYSPLAGITRARSADLYAWTRDARRRERARNPPGDRDPYQLVLADRRLVYSVGSRVAPEGTYGQIVVTESRAGGATWTPARPILEEPETSFAWGNLESPFVVSVHGGYYRFVTRTDEGYGVRAWVIPRPRGAPRRGPTVARPRAGDRVRRARSVAASRERITARGPKIPPQRTRARPATGGSCGARAARARRAPRAGRVGFGPLR
jgi:hypothetical protein